MPQHDAEDDYEELLQVWSEFRLMVRLMMYFSKKAGKAPLEAEDDH